MIQKCKSQSTLRRLQKLQNCSVEIANVHSLLSFSLCLVCTLGSEREEQSACTWEWRPIETIETYKSRC